jgi:hypothetical protein
MFGASLDQLELCTSAQAASGRAGAKASAEVPFGERTMSVRPYAALLGLILAGTVAFYGQAQPEAAPAPGAAKESPLSLGLAQRSMQGGIDYTKGSPIFPSIFAPYRVKEVPRPNYTNSPRIGQFLKDGKLTLSLNDTIALGLENNLDLSIARYNLSIADTEIMRTKSGATTQGVNTGVVQGT